MQNITLISPTLEKRFHIQLNSKELSQRLMRATTKEAIGFVVPTQQRFCSYFRLVHLLSIETVEELQTQKKQIFVIHNLWSQRPLVVSRWENCCYQVSKKKNVWNSQVKILTVLKVPLMNLKQWFESEPQSKAFTDQDSKFQSKWCLFSLWNFQQTARKAKERKH